MKGITVVFPALNGKSSSFHGKIKLFRTQASKFKEARVMIGWMHRSIQMFWRAKGTDEDCHQEGMRLLLASEIPRAFSRGSSGRM
jgi:hypothetical protein